MNASESGSCSNPCCDYPDVSCNLGHLNPSVCEYINAAKNGDTTNLDPNTTVFPWTGRAFGLNDLRFVAGCRKPLTVGVVGSHDAGKTTLLAMLFLMLIRGVLKLDHRQFAGSYTLEGWEGIARWLQQLPQHPIRFPPHTTSKGERTPGLLHLTFADKRRVLRDVLITDAPGEWFNNWAKNEYVTDAEGARWVSRSADKILLIADTEALSGKRKGSARNDFQWLARRLHGAARGRPVALVWTKTDIKRSKQLISTIEQHFEELFPGAPVFSVHVPSEKKDESNENSHIEELQSVFAWALTDSIAMGEYRRPKIDVVDDAFLAYGGSNP